jgi:hypothetical protein
MGAVNIVVDAMNALPEELLAGWAAWLTVGLGLAVWFRRSPATVRAFPAPGRPGSGVRAAARPRQAPRSSSPSTPRPDAFGELQALLDDAPADAGHRPGD